MSSDVVVVADSSLLGGNNNHNARQYRTVRVLVATTGVTYKISLYPAELT